MEIKSPMAWKTPVNLVFAPDLIATLVRAIAAVAGIPPKNGSIKFPTPCAINSWSLFNCFPVILPALAPQSKLSIIPNIAILNAGAIKPVTLSKLIAEKSNLFSGSSVFGISPTTATSNFIAIETAVANIILINDAGTIAFHFLGNTNINIITNTPIATAVILGENPKLP